MPLMWPNESCTGRSEKLERTLTNRATPMRACAEHTPCSRFRLRVEAIEAACRLTHTTDKRFLVASHMKPWRLCDNVERLDGHNGLLLAPHVDHLFDKGWISFADDGTILCADADIKSLMLQWGLHSEDNVGRFNERQRQY